MEFQVKDIVRFKDESKVRPDYLHNKKNIYQICLIDNGKAKLTRDFSPVIEAQLGDLTAVAIDGTEDRFVYYDPIVAASYVAPGCPTPVHHRDYTYYLDARATFPHDKTMRDFVKENSFKYVHQLQHYMREHFCSDDLKINI